MSFENHVGLVLIKEEPDYCELALEFHENLQNYYGIFHGGAYFTLADQAAGYAAKSNGVPHVTANATIHYMIAVNEGKLTACAKVINRAGKLCIVDVNIYNDDNVLVNKATFTMYAINTTKDESH